MKRQNNNHRCCSLIKTLFLFTNLFVNGFTIPKPKLKTTALFDSPEMKTLVPWKPKSNPNVGLNNFFKEPVPEFIKDTVAIVKVNEDEKDKFGVVSQIISPPQYPGVPRPLWVVIAASIPTGLVWYGYYKFCIEEELMELELERGIPPRGFGGFGTLGPFTYGLLLGPFAELLHLPGGMNWSLLGIIFIYYTQFTLYDRVNELYTQMENDDTNLPPLTIWWTWPIFFPLNLIVGLRQVHFLSEYMYTQRGIINPPSDPVVDFFPFIKERNLTFQDLLLKKRLWCALLSNLDDGKVEDLPSFLQIFFTDEERKVGEERKLEEKILKAKMVEKERIEAQREAEERRVKAENEARIAEEKEEKRKEEERVAAAAEKEAQEAKIVQEKKLAEEQRLITEKAQEELKASETKANEEAKAKEAQIKAQEKITMEEKRLADEREAIIKEIAEEKRLDAEQEAEQAKIVKRNAEMREMDRKLAMEQQQASQSEVEDKLDDEAIESKEEAAAGDDFKPKKNKKVSPKLSQRPAAKGFKKE